MKYLRLLRRRLSRQLECIYQDRMREADELGAVIELNVAWLEKNPPRGDSPTDKIQIERLYAQCHELNELIGEHFATLNQETRDELLAVQLQRQLNDFNSRKRE